MPLQLISATEDEANDIRAGLQNGNLFRNGERSRSPKDKGKGQVSKGTGKGAKKENAPGESQMKVDGDEPIEEEGTAAGGTDFVGVDLLKSILNLQQRAREDEGALYNCSLLLATSPLSVCGLSTAKAYGRKAKLDPYNHGMGPPMFQIFMKMMAILIDSTKDIATAKPWWDHLAEWHGEAKLLEIEDLADIVRHWKLTPCYSPTETVEKVKLTYLLYGMCMINGKPVMLQTCMAKVIRAVPHSERKVGKAPPMRQERNNQKSLQNFLWQAAGR
jgi:hypothetical protein